MSTVEKISADLNLAESKKQNLHKTFQDLLSHSSAIASLTLQWRDLEDHFTTIQSSLQHRFKELESKEQNLNSIQILIKERLKDLESKESDFAERLKKQEFNEKKRFEKVKIEPQDDFDFSSNANIRFCVTMDGRGLQLFLNEKSCDDCEKIGDEVYDAIRMSADPAKLVLDAMEGFYAPHLRRGDNKEFETSVVRRSCVILLEQLMRVSPPMKPIVRLEAARVAGEWKGKMRMVESGDWFEVLGFLLLVGNYGLVSDFDGDEISKLFGIVDKHRQVPELRRTLGISGSVSASSILHPPVKIDQSPSENVQLNNTGPSLSVSPWPELKSFCISMDGTGLRLFLSEHVKEHNAMQTEVFDALQCASDPVKLVLDSLQGFNSGGPGVVKGKLGVNRRSCTLLLEQLMRVSPKIEPQMKEEAMKIALDWKAKFLKLEDPVKVLGFLQLLATFGLGSSFDADELLCLLKMAHRLKQAPEFWKIFGLADKIPRFIDVLIQKKQRLEAIRYIYAYNLVGKYPPVRLLKAHVSYSKTLAEKTLREGNNSRQALNLATKNEKNALIDAIKCIEEHKLESEYSPKIIQKRIARLVKQENDRKGTAKASAFEIQPQKQIGIKRPRHDVSTETATNTSRQPAGLLAYEGAPDLSSSAGYYSLGASTHNPHLSSLAGPYAVAGSTLLTRQMNSPARQYGSDIAASSITGQFGLAGTHIGGMHSDISSPDMPIHYYYSQGRNYVQCKEGHGPP